LFLSGGFLQDRTLKGGEKARRPKEQRLLQVKGKGGKKVSHREKDRPPP